MIEHWVHLRCAGIRQAQYTDTWTCHLHRESRLTTHTDITPPHHSRPWSKPLPPTPPQPRHRHTSNTPLVPTTLVKLKPNPLIHSPHSPLTPPLAKHIHISHTPPTSHAPQRARCTATAGFTRPHSMQNHTKKQHKESKHL